MKQNKLFILLLLAACSKQDGLQTLYSRLESKQLPNAFLDRQVAAEPAADVCFKDSYTLDNVKAEIAQLEKLQSSGAKVEGTWKHLKLADLPIPQANFLKEYGSKIGDLDNPDAIDYTGCSDVPCIYNRIYGKEDHIAGYVHYLWYLKMGHMLSADNHVKDQWSKIPGEYNGKKFKLTDYLYSDKELFAFWRLTKMLKGAYVKLDHMVEVQRLPKGEAFQDVEKQRRERDAEVKRRKDLGLITIEEENKQRALQDLDPIFTVGNTCGLAWSDGYIILQDGCLTVLEERDNGYFFPAVTHELSHQIDYFEGRKAKRSYRSQGTDYWDVAGYVLTDYTDPKTGIISKKYTTKAGFKSITFYAGTSIAENFAETLAYFRIEGITAKKNLTEVHRTWTSKNYFFNDFYDPESLMKRWLKNGQAELTQASFSAVAACSTDKAPKVSTFFNKNDFTVPLLPAMVNCLGSKGNEIYLQQLTKAKRDDPQACSVIKENQWRTDKVDFQALFKAEMKLLLDKYLQELQKDKGYFARVQSFYDSIPDKTIAGNAYVSCYNAEDPQSCYREEVMVLALEKAKPLNLPEEHSADLAQLYADNHDYEDTKQHVDNTYKAFVTSHRQSIQDGAEELWRSCENVVIDDVATPTGRHFSLSDGYMVSSIFNCLNAQYPDATKHIVRNLAVDGMKLQHPNEELIMQAEVMPELSKMLSALYKRESEKELKVITELIPAEAIKVRAVLTSNFVWVKDVINSESTQVECERQAMNYVPKEPRFNLKNEVYKGFAQSVCQNITGSTEYSNWLESSRSDFQSKAYENLESKVLIIATYRAKECIKKYPIDTNLNRVRYKKEREFCLLGDWYLYEESALKEFKNDPLVQKFNIDSMPMQGRLEESRRRLQLKMIKEHFEK